MLKGCCNILLSESIGLDESCSLSNHGMLPKLLSGFADIKASCGELCNVSPESAQEFLHPGPYFDAVWKNFDCDQLFSHDFDSKVPQFKNPLPWKKIPYDAQKELNLQGLFAVDVSHHGGDKSSFVNSTWAFEEVEMYRKKIRRKIAVGNYGHEADLLIEKSLRSHMSMRDKHVLVIGSEKPWLEAFILEAGAKKVTTLGKYSLY